MAGGWVSCNGEASIHYTEQYRSYACPVGSVIIDGDVGPIFQCPRGPRCHGHNNSINMALSHESSAAH